MLPVQTVQALQPIPLTSIELVPLSARALSWNNPITSPQSLQKKENEPSDPELIEEFTLKLSQELYVDNLLWRPQEAKFSLVPYFQAIWQELERWTLIRGLRGQYAFHPYSKQTHRFRDIELPKKNAIFMSGKVLHANCVYLKRCERAFIAAQYPQELVEPIKKEPIKKMTARELFWVSAAYYGSIIDLTHSGDKNISPYYPLKEQLSTYEHLIIQRQKITELSKEMREMHYLVTDRKWGDEKVVKRIHFPWKKPRYVSLDPLCQLVNLVESMSTRVGEYICIHCTNGVGRTGTLITAYFLKQQIQRGEVTHENFGFSLINMICKFRKQRGPSFVSKPKQLRQLLEYGEFILSQNKGP